MQILHSVLQKSEDRRIAGNLKKFSLTELTMTEKNNLEKNLYILFHKNNLRPKFLQASANQPICCLQFDDKKHTTKCNTSGRNPKQKQMPRKMIW